MNKTECELTESCLRPPMRLFLFPEHHTGMFLQLRVNIRGAAFAGSDDEEIR